MAVYLSANILTLSLHKTKKSIKHTKLIQDLTHKKKKKKRFIKKYIKMMRENNNFKHFCIV